MHQFTTTYQGLQRILEEAVHSHREWQATPADNVHDSDHHLAVWSMAMRAAACMVTGDYMTPQYRAACALIRTRLEAGDGAFSITHALRREFIEAQAKV